MYNFIVEILKKNIQNGAKSCFLKARRQEHHLRPLISVTTPDAKDKSKHAKLYPSVLSDYPAPPHQAACTRSQISTLKLGTQVFHFHCEAPDSKTRVGTQEAS